MTRETTFDIGFKVKGRIKRDVDTAVAMGTGARRNPEGHLWHGRKPGHSVQTLPEPLVLSRERPESSGPPGPPPLTPCSRLTLVPVLLPGHVPGEAPRHAGTSRPSASAHICSAPSPATCLPVHLLVARNLISLP